MYKWFPIHVQYMSERQKHPNKKRSGCARVRASSINCTYKPHNKCALKTKKSCLLACLVAPQRMEEATNQINGFCRLTYMELLLADRHIRTAGRQTDRQRLKERYEWWSQEKKRAALLYTIYIPGVPITFSLIVFRLQLRLFRIQKKLVIYLYMHTIREACTPRWRIFQ